MFCGLPLVVSPFAWALGRNALKEIARVAGSARRARARPGPDMVMGIIGTVLLGLAVLALIGFALVIATARDGLAPKPSGASQGAADEHGLVDQLDAEPGLHPVADRRGRARAARRSWPHRGW